VLSRALALVRIHKPGQTVPIIACERLFARLRARPWPTPVPPTAPLCGGPRRGTSAEPFQALAYLTPDRAIFVSEHRDWQGGPGGLSRIAANRGANARHDVVPADQDPCRALEGG